MVVLDTDHLSELDRGSPAGARLQERLVREDQEPVATIISAEEQFRGWLAQIHQETNPHRQVETYARLQRRIAFYAAWTVLPWDAGAAGIFLRLRDQGVRVGTMDLKIASIALAHGCPVLTGNLQDFQRIPGLEVEDWLRPQNT